MHRSRRLRDHEERSAPSTSGSRPANHAGSSRCGRRAASGSRSRVAAPGEEAAEVGFGVLSGGAFEPGQVGSHGQPQRVATWRRKIGKGLRPVRDVHHDPTVRLRPATLKPANPHQARQMRAPVGDQAVAGGLLPRSVIWSRAAGGDVSQFQQRPADPLRLRG